MVFTLAAGSGGIAASSLSAPQRADRCDRMPHPACVGATAEVTSGFSIENQTIKEHQA
jgi:hypothetical protein